MAICPEHRFAVWNTEEAQRLLTPLNEPAQLTPLPRDWSHPPVLSADPATWDATMRRVLKEAHDACDASASPDQDRAFMNAFTAIFQLPRDQGLRAMHELVYRGDKTSRKHIVRHPKFMKPLCTRVLKVLNGTSQKPMDAVAYAQAVSSAYDGQLVIDMMYGQSPSVLTHEVQRLSE